LELVPSFAPSQFVTALQLLLLGRPGGSIEGLAASAADACTSAAADNGSSGFIAESEFVAWFTRITSGDSLLQELSTNTSQAETETDPSRPASAPTQTSSEKVSVPSSRAALAAFLVESRQVLQLHRVSLARLIEELAQYVDPQTGQVQLAGLSAALDSVVLAARDSSSTRSGSNTREIELTDRVIELADCLCSSFCSDGETAAADFTVVSV
jgi:hypothetical protein